MSRGPRHLQHQGRRRQDVGRGQPRLSGRARRAAHAAVGPRPAGRARPTCSGSSRRSAAAASKLVRCKSDVDDADQGHRPSEAWTCCRPTSPTATWTSRSTSFKKPTRRLARVLEPLDDEYDCVFLDCPPSISLVSESVFEAADVLLVPIIPATLSSRTIDQLDAVVADARRTARAAAGARVLLDGRRPQALHREVMERLRAERDDVLERGDPGVGRGRADGRGARRDRRVRPARPCRAGLRGAVARACARASRASALTESER